HVIWYHRTTGIWQPVWLEVVGDTHILDLRWTPDLARNVLGLTAAIKRGGDQVMQVQARVRLSLHGRVLADDLCLVPGSTLQREFALDAGTTDLDPEQLLWSPERPNLIEAAVSLLADGAEVDAVQSYAGLRGVGTGQGRFLLNGRPVFLRLAL